MKTKLLVLTITFILVSASEFVYSQSRYPVQARVSLNQRLFEPPETSLSLQELRFTGRRSHSMGMGVGVDFGLNQLESGKSNWILTTSMNVFTVPLRYDATMPKETHGFDHDVTWSFERYSSGFEAVLGIARETALNPKWNLRLGLGANIQDMYFSSSKLEHSAIISRNGSLTSERIFGTNFDPFFGFGSNPRQKQDLQFNAVYSVGFVGSLENDRQFIAEIKVCHSNQNIVQPLNFLFGDDGNFIYKKSYVGVDLAYRFSLNRSLSSGVK